MYEIFVQLLQEYGVTTYKVAKETGISQTTFSNWKSGRSVPKADALEKIADYFNVRIDYLLGRSNIPNKKEHLHNEDIKFIEYVFSKLSEDNQEDYSQMLDRLSLICDNVNSESIKILRQLLGEIFHIQVLASKHGMASKEPKSLESNYQEYMQRKNKLSQLLDDFYNEAKN